MNELEALREQFRGDRFATEQAGITISEAHEGYALCEMPLTPLHRNARGTSSRWLILPRPSRQITA